MVEYLHESKRPSDQCLYPSKTCYNKRAKKLNGQPHKLCEEHRQQANRNQKRLQQRRRMREFQQLQLFVLDTFAQAPEPSDRRVSQVDAIPVEVFRSNETAMATTRSETFWGVFDDDVEMWTASLGTLSPLRADDDERLRELVPGDIEILRALLLDT